MTMTDDVDRLLVGLATVFGQPGLGGIPPWPAEAFHRFVGLETAIPLKVSHQPIATIYSNGQVVTSVGRAFDFAIVPEASTPAGLRAGDRRPLRRAGRAQGGAGGLRAGPASVHGAVVGAGGQPGRAGRDGRAGPPGGRAGRPAARAVRADRLARAGHGDDMEAG